MKRLGVGLLVFGLIFGFFALNMDTSVATEAQTIAGISIPSVRVNNIGLMQQQQNYLLLSGLAALVGVVLIVAGNSHRTSSNPVESDAAPPALPKKCPYCAEDIKAEAVLCRYCGRDVPAQPDPTEAEGHGEPRVGDGGEADAAQEERIKILLAAVANQSQRVRDCGDDLPAAEVFELGCRWSLLFDETGNAQHRAKALAAMRKARAIDSEVRAGFFDAHSRFGSLADDPEFREFA